MHLAGILSLLFLACFSPARGMAKKNKTTKTVEYKLTVARIAPSLSNDKYMEVSFLESARFYLVSKKARPTYIDLLRASEKSNKPVMVKRANERSDTIISVRKCK